MSEAEQQEIRELLAQLMTEHRDLDAAIVSLEESASIDQLQLRRLKRRKLQLRDRIADLETRLLPDIIA